MILVKGEKSKENSLKREIIIANHSINSNHRLLSFNQQ